MVISGVPTISSYESVGNRKEDLLNIFRKVLPDLEKNVRRMEEEIESEHHAELAVSSNIGVIQTILLELSNIAACVRFEEEQTMRDRVLDKLGAKNEEGL
tara:strand:+ start:1828 stop:2127 length:300 start_codon:yes stop_codon:yes gene_type:complete